MSKYSEKQQNAAFDPLDTKASPSIKATHKQHEIPQKMLFEWRFLQPRFWGIWLILAMILPLIWLPLRHQFMLGRGLGRLLFKLAKRRREDTLINLKLAFPKKSDEERLTLARQVFINQGIGIFESLSAWFMPEKFARTFSVSGLQHLIQAQKDGKAVLLLGAHYTLLDLGGVIATQFFTADCVYRPQNNPVFEWLIFNRRRHIFEAQIAHKDMKKLASRIKAGKVIWYTPDQDFGLEHGVMADFFGVPAATITAQRRLAKLGDKKNPPAVIIIAMHRTTPDFIPRGKRPHYHLNFSPTLDNYPSHDEHADANRINAMIEENIKKDPTQWMWFHRRFKTQADGTDYYKKNPPR